MNLLTSVPKIDCHLHLLDPQNFPYQDSTAYRPSGQEIGTYTQLNAVFAANGIDRALLVQPTSGYGTDNSAMLDAIQRSGMKWRGIALVEPDVSLSELTALKRAGIVGVAYNMPFYQPGYFDKFHRVTEMLAELDMVLDIQFEGDGVFEAQAIMDIAPVRVTIDHCGRPDLAAGLNSAAFQQLLRLSEREAETVMKLSGQHKFAAFPWPFEAAVPVFHELLSAFTPDRCVWGSDWPFLRVPQRVDYGPVVRLAADLLKDEDTQAKVFHKTAKRVFWSES